MDDRSDAVSRQCLSWTGAVDLIAGDVLRFCVGAIGDLLLIFEASPNNFFSPTEAQAIGSYLRINFVRIA